MRGRPNCSARTPARRSRRSCAPGWPPSPPTTVRVPARLRLPALRALLLTADEYTVDDLHYQASYEDAGLRVLQRDPALPITGLERFWIGSVTLSNEAAG